MSVCIRPVNAFSHTSFHALCLMLPSNIGKTEMDIQWMRSWTWAFVVEIKDTNIHTYIRVYVYMYMYV